MWHTVSFLANHWATGDSGIDPGMWVIMLAPYGIMAVVVYRLYAWYRRGGEKHT